MTTDAGCLQSSAAGDGNRGAGCGEAARQCRTRRGCRQHPTRIGADLHVNCHGLLQLATANVAQDAEAGAAVQDEARLRLLAHIYSNQVAHLTTGMRVGAKTLFHDD